MARRAAVAAATRSGATTTLLVLALALGSFGTPGAASPRSNDAMASSSDSHAVDMSPRSDRRRRSPTCPAGVLPEALRDEVKAALGDFLDL